MIDAGSHEVEVTGASAKPFPTPATIDLNLVGLQGPCQDVRAGFALRWSKPPGGALPDDEP